MPSLNPAQRAEVLYLTTCYTLDRVARDSGVPLAQVKEEIVSDMRARGKMSRVWNAVAQWSKSEQDRLFQEE
jgi:hypothetical protein